MASRKRNNPETPTLFKSPLIGQGDKGVNGLSSESERFGWGLSPTGPRLVINEVPTAEGVSLFSLPEPFAWEIGNAGCSRLFVYQRFDLVGNRLFREVLGQLFGQYPGSVELVEFDLILGAVGEHAGDDLPDKRRVIVGPLGKAYGKFWVGTRNIGIAPGHLV